MHARVKRCAAMRGKDDLNGQLTRRRAASKICPDSDTEIERPHLTDGEPPTAAPMRTTLKEMKAQLQARPARAPRDARRLPLYGLALLAFALLAAPPPAAGQNAPEP